MEELNKIVGIVKVIMFFYTSSLDWPNDAIDLPYIYIYKVYI